MRKAQIVPITAGELNARGQATARFGELPLYIPGLLPGERADVEIVRRSSSYALGQVLRRHSSSAQRVASDCSAFPRCGGCTVRHLSYDGQLQAKRTLARQQAAAAGLLLPEHLPVHPAPSTTGYRNRAIHACAPMDAKQGTGLQTGLYGPDSQQLVAVDRCQVEPELHDQLRARLRGWATREAIPIWTRERPRGLRHILLRSNAERSALVLGLIGYDLELPLPALRTALEGFALTGCFQLEQRDAHSNTILDGQITPLWGELQLSEQVAHCSLRTAATDFFQLNAGTTNQIAEALCAGVTRATRVLEFYSGSGTFSLPLARAAQQLLGFERESAAVDCARANAAANAIDTAHFHGLDLASPQLGSELTRTCGPGGGTELIVADPPRKGMSPALRDWIAHRAAPRLLLLACDGDSGARDAQYFVQRGYRLAALDLYDMFPGTLQAEWLIDLQR